MPAERLVHAVHEDALGENASPPNSVYDSPETTSVEPAADSCHRYTLFGVKPGRYPDTLEVVTYMTSEPPSFRDDIPRQPSDPESDALPSPNADTCEQVENPEHSNLTMPYDASHTYAFGG